MLDLVTFIFHRNEANQTSCREYFWVQSQDKQSPINEVNFDNVCVSGEVSKYDIISQEQKVIMSGHGRVYCIDIKDDILVVGLPSGLIR